MTSSKINRKLEYLLYIENGKIIGYINYYLMYEEIEIANFNVLDEFQNRGIGQTALKSIVDDIFNGLVVGRIIILPINERSRAIATKNGFQRKLGSQRIFQLNRERWVELQKGMNKNELKER